MHLKCGFTLQGTQSVIALIAISQIPVMSRDLALPTFHPQHKSGMTIMWNSEDLYSQIDILYALAMQARKFTSKEICINK